MTDIRMERMELSLASLGFLVQNYKGLEMLTAFSTRKPFFDGVYVYSGALFSLVPLEEGKWRLRQPVDPLEDGLKAECRSYMFLNNMCEELHTVFDSHEEAVAFISNLSRSLEDD